MTDASRNPIREAGRELALEVHKAALEFESGTYIVTVDDEGTVEVFIPWESQVVRCGVAVALNLRGMLEAIRRGTIR